MKINVWFIVIEHIKTLSVVNDDKSETQSKADVFVFYLLPLTLGMLVCWRGFEVKDAVFELSVSVFAIFSALLLSVQVAMYGVFRADRKDVEDKILNDEMKTRIGSTRKIIREININISYLILISCVSVLVFLAFFTFEFSPHLESGILIMIYAHFILTVAMVLKRSHLVFDAEYR